MKKSILIVALLFTSLSFSYSQGAKQERTLFGNSYNVEMLVQLEYNGFTFYVVKDCPIHKLYKEDTFKYSVFMAIEFKKYSNEFKTLKK